MTSALVLVSTKILVKLNVRILSRFGKIGKAFLFQSCQDVKLSILMALRLACVQVMLIRLSANARCYDANSCTCCLLHDTLST